MTSISVIIPSYNCARFIGESVESVLRQSVPPSEVIVVDDGSTDDTLAVLDSYAGRVKVVRAPHGGYASARNHGLAHAAGDWIAFHDADDVALEDRLAVHLEWLARRPDADGMFANGARLDEDAALVPPELAASRDLGVEDVFAGFPVYFQAALVRRATLEDIGPFETSLRVHADMDYGYRLFARRRIGFLDRVVFRYRWHDANVTRDALRGREEIARVLARVAERDPGAVRRIGRRRFHARLARHWYQIARRRLRLGDDRAARAALDCALALRPLDPRYRLLRLWHAA
jgi:glycosyltransferase involved in cell wall biosynthesis